MQIKDSGARRQFDTGAVRDTQEGKGRYDLIPLTIVGDAMNDPIVTAIGMYQSTGDVTYLQDALRHAFTMRPQYEILSELAAHFEGGAIKYGENNWRKGIPLTSYIDSSVRHYNKYKLDIQDEPHFIAFVWNMVCAIWTHGNDFDDKIDIN